MILGFSNHHRDAIAGGGVMHYFLSPQPRNGSESKRQPVRNPPPERLLGNPQIFDQTVKALPFQNRYRSGVLSFAATDIDSAAFNAGDVKARAQVSAIVDLLKAALFPGIPVCAQPELIVGTHTHAGRLEINFAVPQVITRPDGTFRAFNPEPPTEGAKAFWVATRDLINLRFGFADPEAPTRKQLVSGPSWRRKCAAANARASIKSENQMDDLIAGLAEEALRQKCQNRDDFIQIVNAQFQPLNMQVILASHSSLTVGPLGDDGQMAPFRLKGLLCHRTFSRDHLMVFDPDAAAARQAFVQTAPKRFAAAWAKTAEFNAKKFGQRVWQSAEFDSEAWLSGTQPSQTVLPQRHHLLPITSQPKETDEDRLPDPYGKPPAGYRQPDAPGPSTRAGRVEVADNASSAGNDCSAIKDRPIGQPASSDRPVPECLGSALGHQFAPAAIGQLTACLTAAFRWIAENSARHTLLQRVGQSIPQTLIAALAVITRKQEKLNDLIRNYAFFNFHRSASKRTFGSNENVGGVGACVDGALERGCNDDGWRGAKIGRVDRKTDVGSGGAGRERQPTERNFWPRRSADADGHAHGSDRKDDAAPREGPGSDTTIAVSDRAMDGGRRLTAPPVGSRIWMIATVRKAMEYVAEGLEYSLTPSVDPDGRFAIFLDIGQTGSLRLSMTKLDQLGAANVSRLRAIAAHLAQKLGLTQPDVAKHQPKQKFLMLYENDADFAACKRVAVAIPGVEVIVKPAMPVLTNQNSIHALQEALRNGKLAGCTLAAGSCDGPRPDVEAAWLALEALAGGYGTFDMFTFAEDGIRPLVRPTIPLPVPEAKTAYRRPHVHPDEVEADPGLS